MITAEQVRRAAKGSVNAANLASVLVALSAHGAVAGLDLPHREVPYMAQLMHESGSFRYDREIWGPTPAQERYDTRTDLGNTPAKDGDGKKYMGRTGMQLTGKANYAAFTEWCRRKGLNPPDFVKTPDLVNTDPWEGLVPIWYWDEGNPSRKSLNRYADKGDQEMITKRINGGLNGFADRLDYYTRIGLVVLGFGPTEILAFQKKAKAAGMYAGDLDNDDGPQTRSAIHMMLSGLSAVSNTETTMPTVTAAPVVETTVVETTVDKPVVPAKVEAEVRQKTNWISTIFGGLFGAGGVGAFFSGMDKDALLLVAGIGLVVVVVVLVGGEWIIRRIRSIKQAVEA